MKKVIFYIDGNNWYHNVKKYYNPSDIDIKKIINFIKDIKKYSLIEIIWYVSVPSIEDGEKMYYQHMAFLDHLRKNGITVKTRKLQKLSNKEILNKKGNIINSLDLCNLCKPIIIAQFLDIETIKRKEKGIDVSIVVDMINDSLISKRCDVTVIISGDADFVPALELIKNSGHEVLSASVPLGYSSELRKKFPYFIINPETLKKCFRDHKIKDKKENT